MSALERRQPREFPSAQNLRWKALREPCMSRAEGQLKVVIKNQPMPQIVVRRPAVFFEIERVSCSRTIPARCDQRIGGIIDRMGPGVRRLKLYSPTELPAQHHLQSVVS